jgi:hypothetical protein
MTFITILVGLVALSVAGVIAARLMTRRRDAIGRRPRQARLHPESLLADRDDTQARVEALAAQWRRAQTRAN